MEEQAPFFSPSVPKSEGALVSTEQFRAIQEVQAAMIVAKRFPRDSNESYLRIMKACERKTLAKEAMYAYPRGGQQVTGPSIRLAEVLAQSWGNLNFGVRELSQANGESEVEAFAWDLETNTKQVKVFRVPHTRKAKGKNETLSDPRDIYEHVASQAARRLRACILGIIPGDIVDAAVDQCEKTLQKDEKPMEDRIRDMLVAFNEFGVSKEMIEARLLHKIEATIPPELSSLIKIYKSIKDGMSKREDWFVIKAPAAPSETAESLTAEITGKKEAPKSPETKPEVKPEPKVDPPTETKKPENGNGSHESGEVAYKAWCLKTLEADPDKLNEALRALNFSNIPAGVSSCKKVYEAYQGIKSEKF